MAQSEVRVTVECLGALKGHNGWVTSLVVGQGANGPLLVSGSRDRLRRSSSRRP